MDQSQPEQERQRMRVHRLDYARIFSLGGILGMLLVYGIFAVQHVQDPALNTSMDFIHFYSAGRISQQYGFSQIYNLDLQKQFEENQLGFKLGNQQFLPFNHPPYILLPLTMIVSSNYPASYSLWMICLAGIIFASMLFLKGLLPQKPGNWRLLFLGGSLFLPILVSIIQGQDTAFMLMGASIFTWGMLNQHETTAGFGLSLLTLRPQLALFFIIPLFFWSRPAWRSFIFGSALLALASLLMVGWQGSLDFIHVLQVSAGGKGYGLNESAMFNLLGLTLRLFPLLDAGFVRQMAWGLFLIAALGTSLVFAYSKISKEILFAISILAALLTSPHLHYHDLSLMLIPTIILAREVCKENGNALRLLSLTAASISLMLILTSKFPSLYFNLPYLLSGVLIFFLLKTGRVSTQAMLNSLAK